MGQGGVKARLANSFPIDRASPPLSPSTFYKVSLPATVKMEGRALWRAEWLAGDGFGHWKTDPVSCASQLVPLYV